MQGKRENISVAGSKGDQDLRPEFTYDEMWAEIDNLFVAYEERQPGDIDYHDIVARYNITQNAAYYRMGKLVQSGKYKSVQVRGLYGPIRVIRRI